jgi:hypothetical protein
MQPATPPDVIDVEIVPAQPTDADSRAIAHLSSSGSKSLAPVTYLVKLRFQSMPEATSHGWALYVNDFRIPKYWEYRSGIYFKVFDPQFFQDHQGEPIRFSLNGADFIDTGLKLAAPDSGVQRSMTPSTKLPAQEDVLK